MKKIVVIGSGISGMCAAVKLAEAGIHVTLVSPAPSERSQSVMAQGGINAVGPDCEMGDSVEKHIQDTLKGGSYLAGKQAVRGLCEHGGEILRYLEEIGTVFSVDEQGHPSHRAFGGQSYKRTYFCGSSTGKQIVSALIMETRRLEASGTITRKLWTYFHSCLMKDGVCHGVILFDERKKELAMELADAVVIATGGQNALFGKTTGSTMCDGYAIGKLFLQGAELKNLEFIQYHPTTLATGQKRMLISEAVRGEGGRLFFEENGKRVYFMEEKYGPKGNLMTRDVISREIAATGRKVYLDISFLGKKEIDRRLSEVRDVCMKYRGLDICQSPIPVSPCVHFFMGGLAVHLNHETNIQNLFAVGECASMYHGANRLGGNSLLAAIYSGFVAADTILDRDAIPLHPDFSSQLKEASDELDKMKATKSPFPVMYIRDMLAQNLQHALGIVRREDSLSQGIQDLDYYLATTQKISYDSSVMMYYNYSLTALLALARATLTCALERRESRGSHYRSDYPQTEERFQAPTLIAYQGGEYRVRLDKEHAYEG